MWSWIYRLIAAALAVAGAAILAWVGEAVRQAGRHAGSMFSPIESPFVVAVTLVALAMIVLAVALFLSPNQQR